MGQTERRSPPWRSASLGAALSSLVLFGSVAEADELTSERAVALAAAENPTLRAALLDVAAARAALRGEEDARVPVLFADVEGHYDERLSGTSKGVSRSADGGLAGGVGVRYTTEIGTSLEAGAKSDIAWRISNLGPETTESVTIPPSWGAELYVTARQPLLRDAGTDVVLAPVREAETGRTQAERAADEAASQLVLDVLTAYYELWYAERAVAVEEQGLALASRQLDEVELRVRELGTVPPTETLSFATAVATLRESVAAARATRATRAIELGRLLALKPQVAKGLIAVSPPPETPQMPPVERMIEEARAKSPELAGLEAQIENARERLRVSANATEPRLDLTGSFTMTGVWTDDELPGIVLPDGRPAFGGTLGLELELPLGNSKADADYARAVAQLEAAEARYEARVAAIEADVAAQHGELEAGAEQLALANESVRVSKALAEAERQRVGLGTNTATFLVAAQQNEREAELRYLRALATRAEEQLALDHAAGRLLERYASYFGGEHPGSTLAPEAEAEP